MKKPSFKTGMIICCVTMIALYAIGAGMLFISVDRVAEDAKATYGGDHVGALIALVEDETALFENRNTAIWALGQIGSDRALPALKKLDTEELQTPPYDTTKYIAQYYVEKSIQQIESVSLTKWMYHFL